MGFLAGFEEIVRQAEPLAPHTWLHIGGPAQYFAEPRSVEQLSSLVRRCRQEEVPVRMLGGGSNILVRDEGVPGMVIRLSAPAFTEIRFAKNVVMAGGGAKLGHAISISVRQGLAGLESLVGIPGTIGGALHGNAGGRGGDIGQWTSRATVMLSSGEAVQRERSDLVFAYRQSSLDELVILNAQFSLDEDNPEEVTKRMQKLWIVKKSNQPLSHQSAGCVFKSPQGTSAGQILEQAGLKGARVGGAEVSDRHANYIVTDGSATSSDVLRLIETMQTRVRERLGVELELELQIW